MNGGICGQCGSIETNPDNALCNNCGADFWVQPQDFDNPELKEYVEEAANNLNVSVEKLHDMVQGPTPVNQK